MKLGTPLLIVGGNPALPGGLSRSLRDIATLAATLPQFRVGVLGHGLGQNRRLPFLTYDYDESNRYWGVDILPTVWRDFAGSDPGIVLTTDDPSRRVQFSQLPADLGFRKWGYFPIDSLGPSGSTLSLESIQALKGYDRILAASEWGADAIKRSGLDADWLPHGIHHGKFHPIPSAKAMCGWEDRVVLGCVMANQARKDFGTAFETAYILRREYGDRFLFWLHTDTLIRHWSVELLAADYQLADCLNVSLNQTDEQLALRYSACDCTILPSGGEGFGFPIAESQACGTACIVPNYAAGQEIVDEDCRVEPIAYRLETTHNVKRAVLAAPGFARAAKVQIERKLQDPEYRSEELAERGAHLRWDRLKFLWENWLLEGVK